MQVKPSTYLKGWLRTLPELGNTFARVRVELFRQGIAMQYG